MIDISNLQLWVCHEPEDGVYQVIQTVSAGKIIPLALLEPGLEVEADRLLR